MDTQKSGRIGGFWWPRFNGCLPYLGGTTFPLRTTMWFWPSLQIRSTWPTTWPKEGKPLSAWTVGAVLTSAVTTCIHVVKQWKGQHEGHRDQLQPNWEVQQVQLDQWLGVVLRPCNSSWNNVEPNNGYAKSGRIGGFRWPRFCWFPKDAYFAALVGDKFLDYSNKIMLKSFGKSCSFCLNHGMLQPPDLQQKIAEIQSGKLRWNDAIGFHSKKRKTLISRGSYVGGRRWTRQNIASVEITSWIHTMRHSCFLFLVTYVFEYDTPPRRIIVMFLKKSFPKWSWPMAVCGSEKSVKQCRW